MIFLGGGSVYGCFGKEGEGVRCVLRYGISYASNSALWI